VQSYIDEKGDWKAVFDVSDNAVMLEKAKKGDITGVSIYGAAQKVEKAGAEISAKNKSVLRQAYDLLSGFFKVDTDEPAAVEKSFSGEMAMNDIWRVVNTLDTVIRKTLSDETITDKVAAIKKDIAEFQAYILKNLPIDEITKNKQEGEEMPITKDELKAMLAEINKDAANEADAVAKAAKQTELETTVKTLQETVEKQAKTIEELAKGRKTDSEQTGEITQEMIFKCEDPAKAAEMTKIFKSQKKGK
jgi:hypothetical protein